jgi:hypothetical protein
LKAIHQPDVVMACRDRKELTKRPEVGRSQKRQITVMMK